MLNTKHNGYNIPKKKMKQSKTESIQKCKIMVECFLGKYLVDTLREKMEETN